MKIKKVFFLFASFFVFNSTIKANETEWSELVPIIELEQNIVSGTWTKGDSGLEVTASESARLTLLENKSTNYDLKVSFTRKSGHHSIALLFNSLSGQASFEVDAWGQHLAGLQMVNGQTIKDNETRVNNIRLENGKRNTLELKVRDKHITGILNGEVIVKQGIQNKKLSTLDLWRLPENNMIGIGSYQSNTIFHSIQIRNKNDAQDLEKKTLPKAKEKAERVKLSTIHNFSDEFDKADSLKDWRRVYQTEQSNADQLQKIKIDNGVLNLIPYTSSWYNDYRGVLVYKPIKGDFIVSTKVRATSLKGSGAPNKLYSLAGIMVRTAKDITPKTWRSGQENYIFLSIGAANKPGEKQFEVKTTINSNSNLEISPASSSEAEIKVLRVGASFILLKREAGSWSVHKRYYRPDMPETLQVGMTVYTDWSNVEKINPKKHNQVVIRDGAPDLNAEFDYFRFKRPDISKKYQNANFMSSAEITDRMILDLTK